jgi:hypothetical protein
VGGWYVSDVDVTWSVVDAESTIISQNGCDAQTVTSDTASVSFICSASSAGGTSSQSVTIKRDATASTISFAGRTAPNASGWNNGPVTVEWNCSDATSGATSASASQTVSTEDANQSATGTCTDNAGNSASDTQTGINIDITAPTTSGSYAIGGMQATITLAASDNLSGIASISYSVNGGALQSYTGPFALSGAGSYTISYFSADLAGNTEVAKTLSVNVAATFPTTGVLDSFNRANGKVGGSWEGLTDSSFYKLASNKLDVQLGGPLVWKPASFGASQEAFVTLSTIDSKSLSMGLLLKVQTGSIPNGGGISVVYDAKAKVVRVSALRLERNGAWTLYPNQAATFANGDVLGTRAKANGAVEIYKNGTLIASVTLNAADQAFFNAKGGKIGIWTVAASNAILDDFGGRSFAP